MPPMLPLIGYVLVGALWGCTNPFIKHAQQKAIDTERDTNRKQGVLSSLYRMMKQPQLFLAYAINQSGSVVYYLVLSEEPISRANPICNSLTFVITALVGYLFFNESCQSPLLLLLGIGLVVAGIYVCISE